MTDQAEMAVESEVTPEVTETVTETEVTETQETEATESSSEEESTPEFVEIEVNGMRYEVPAELKDGYMQGADYTRKTQELAEQRKAAETEQQQFQQQQAEVQAQIQRQQANLQGYAHIASLDAQLQQYQNVDWAALIDQDPVEAQKHQFQYTQLKEQRETIARQISQAEQQAQLYQQSEMTKLIEQGQATLAKEIEGWSADTAKQLNDYGMTQGFKAEELAQIYDPRQVKILHKAQLYDQMMAKAQKAPEPTKKPTRKVSSGKTNTKDPANMSTDEWMAWRNKQLA